MPEEEKKFDEVDVKNAVRLIHDYCVSLGISCNECVINTQNEICPLAVVPMAWPVED